jgi:hypothetical protein
VIGWIFAKPAFFKAALVIAFSAASPRAPLRVAIKLANIKINNDLRMLEIPFP